MCPWAEPALRPAVHGRVWPLRRCVCFVRSRSASRVDVDIGSRTVPISARCWDLDTVNPIGTGIALHAGCQKDTILRQTPSK